MQSWVGVTDVRKLLKVRLNQQIICLSRSKSKSLELIKFWYSDITQVRTTEGWLYLAAIIDAFSRRVVGYAMADNMETDLIIKALRMAIKQRGSIRGLIHHSDRGSQYISYAFERELKSQDIRASFTATGACLDNAFIESFFASIKKELIYRTALTTREGTRTVIFEYINITYNRFRLHSSIGYKSPETFEANQQNNLK